MNITQSIGTIDSVTPDSKLEDVITKHSCRLSVKYIKEHITDKRSFDFCRVTEETVKEKIKVLM